MSSRNEPRRPNAGRSGGACTRGEQTHKLVELTRAQCLELLESNDFGRVILTTNSDPTPMIRPVKYRFDSASQSVAFRTGDGAKLFALSHGARAWFELDGIDSLTRTGWSVIISGVTDVVTQPLEIQRLDQLRLDSWAPGEHPSWIRIVARTVTGRRIAPAQPSSGEVDRRSAIESATSRQERDAGP